MVVARAASTVGPMTIAQPSLLDTASAPDVVDVDGLDYRPDWIEATEADALLEHVERETWGRSLARRVQQYGWRYQYRNATVEHSDRLGELPGWLDTLTRRLVAEGWFEEAPDQVIVNEYEPGQGIAPHIDHPERFGPVIATVSLAAAVPLELHGPDGQRRTQLLTPNSLLVLRGDARYGWQHAIAGRKTDRCEGSGIRQPRARRISITFRNVRMGARSPSA